MSRCGESLVFVFAVCRVVCCMRRNGEEVFDSSGGKEIKESTVRLMR